MERKKLDLTNENIEIVGGKVIIESEELASAIQDYNVDITTEEEDFLNICIVIGK